MPAAQPFFAALLARLFPRRPIVVVTESLKTQVIFQQDIETWIAPGGTAAVLSRMGSFAARTAPAARRRRERTVGGLVGLSQWSVTAKAPAPVIVASVTALLQKTFQAGEIARRTRSLKKGDSLDPLTWSNGLSSRDTSRKRKSRRRAIFHCVAASLICGR